MWQRLIVAAGSVLLLLTLARPIQGQLPGPVDETPAPSAPSKPDRSNVVPQYVVVFLSTALILFIICKPARKT
jgi:hypothetical protein